MQILEVKFLKDTLVVKYGHDTERGDHAALNREIFIKYAAYAGDVQSIAESIGQLVSEAELHILGEDEDNEEDMRIKG